MKKRGQRRTLLPLRQSRAAAVDLRLGDCTGRRGLQALAAGSVHVAITDPPFDERTHRAALEHGRWQDGQRQLRGRVPFNPLDSSKIASVAAELVRVTQRWILVFAPERQIEAWAAALEAGGARFVRLGGAVRVNPRPQLSGDRPAPAIDHIVIAHARGPLRWNGRGSPASWDAPPARFDPGGQVHPTQKSLHLMRELVADFSDPGELVCDPFAGAGTTAIACSELGRRFIGWELSRAYRTAALRRLAMHYGRALLRAA